MQTKTRDRRAALSGAAALLLGAAAVAPAVQAQNQPARKRYRAVVHVTDGEPEKWNRVVGFVRGLETSPEKDDLSIAVVVQGLATDMLKTDSPVAKAWADAIGRGVELVACEYSMKTRNLTREQLIPTLSRFVPFGGMEIVKRQGDSWAYLRP